MKYQLTLILCFAPLAIIYIVLKLAQTIDEALHQYYVVERGEEVPNWRYIKDQDWWIEYLKELNIDPRNP